MVACVEETLRVVSQSVLSFQKSAFQGIVIIMCASFGASSDSSLMPDPAV